uniref:RING-type domain-containing protein n=1 Tax=Caenorhabditis tropicalis TaxID=1561998 RepID=A0A1I7UP44_9PELO
MLQLRASQERYDYGGRVFQPRPRRSASKSNEENKKLQERIKRKEAMEIQMKKENTEKMRKINEEMERIQKKSETIQMEMTMRQSKMEEELREKDRVIKELQNDNRQRDMEKNQEMEKAMRLLSGQWEEQGKTIKNLLDRFYPSPVEEECPICTDEMETSQETLKCEVCKKKVHLKCASEWHKKSRSCPICRSPQLNPEDYPSLRG